LTQITTCAIVVLSNHERGLGKMKNSITKAIKELERLYEIINVELFDSQLDPNIRIIIQTKGRKKKVIGFHSPKRWKSGEDFISEITLCAEDLNSSDPAEILIHECVHNYNYMRGISDCCTNQYHNKKFKVVAEQVGLIVERSKVYGWCYTKSGEKAKQVIINSAFNYDLFQDFRLVSTPSHTYQRLFMCSCGMKIRVARIDEFKATCDNCHTPFILAD
jgi:hypothetical protein